MTKAKAKKIFEKYNCASDVVRCPNGRASTRKQVDLYAKAAVNLYGIISRDEFVDIFNKQNIEQTSSEEIYVLLLPLVLKDGWYGFYKEYIVHYWLFDNFDQADYLLKHQEGKPRYIPEREEFLKYEYEEYTDNDHWWNVYIYMRDVFSYNRDIWRAYNNVKNYITYGNGISELGPILEQHNITLSGQEQLQEFIDLIMNAKNNTRIWTNNGFTPFELGEIMSKREKKETRVTVIHSFEVGRNDPCPCGSGKKYKKCCARFDDSLTAQLSPDEAWQFYEIWFGLLSFVNEQKRVVKTKIKPEYPNSADKNEVYKVRDILWENPELIDKYISETKLSQDKVDILKLWRNKYKKGTFFVLKYQSEYAVILASNEQREDRLYGIKGISESVSSALHKELPTYIETVLLPFKGKIIYDSFIVTMPIGFLQGAKDSLQRMHDKAIEHGIIESLE